MMAQVNHFLSIDNIRNARQALKEKGFYFIENGYDQSFCQSVIQFVDSYKVDNSDDNRYMRTEMHYGGSELRIWDAQKKDNLLHQFYQECNLTISRLLRKDAEAHTLLAIRNKSINSDDESLRKGRWHIDSLFKQLKIFVFLTDTTEQSGPFEFIPKTHHSSFKIQMLSKGLYIRPKDFFGEKRAYQKIDDHCIDKLIVKGFQPKPVICRAGTVMLIDTSAIHRARPCIEGARYALTTYYK